MSAVYHPKLVTVTYRRCGHTWQHQYKGVGRLPNTCIVWRGREMSRDHNREIATALAARDVATLGALAIELAGKLERDESGRARRREEAAPARHAPS